MGSYEQLWLRQKYRLRNWAMKWVFDRIRFLVVPDWDINEDYRCEYCGKPVLRRFLFCSAKCSDAEEIAWLKEHGTFHENDDQLP
jgi:endogenous inhibitor of DNA gyrase (YacG/DUF329 family)